MENIKFLRCIIFALSLSTILARNSTLESENEQNTTNSLEFSMSKINSCIGKIRTIAGVNPNFRNNIDRLAQTAQYDAIDKILRNNMFLMCTEDEISAMTIFLDEESASIQIIQLVAQNMTNDERNYNLPHYQYEMLRKSYNKIMNKFANSNLKVNIAQFLNTLIPNDSNKMRAYGTVSEEDKLIAFINKKMASTNFTDNDRREIEQYLKGLFMSLKLD
ncbi:unnamed protein product [Onchocerca ochengi]|uniref:Uncharacterized protein n=2 Tax=Onchocerca TaxID=6281 RepID=A0A182EEZ0_ONCOC|nr:unnamed protein product [Onchocerca ochengi]